jgi:hypothetical protein
MKTAAVFLAFVATAVSLACGLAVWHGGLSPGIAWCALAGGAAAGGLAAWTCPRASRRPFTIWDVLAGVLFGLFSLRAFCWLVFADGNEIKVLSPNNLGDLSLHLTFINYFAHGAPFWPANPIFPQQSLRYHFGTDLFNSLLVCCGADVFRSLIQAGLAGCALTWITLRRWGGAFAVAGFLCAGGVAGFQFLAGGVLDDYQSDLAWKSLPLALFICQRPFLYALPAGLALLTSWRNRAIPGENGDAWRMPLWLEVLLLGTMPLFHMHTFLALAFLAGGFVITGPASLRRHALAVLGGSFIPATLLVLKLTDGFHANSGLHLQPGWMQGKENPFVFWFVNFGFAPVLVAALCAVLCVRWKSQRVATAFVLPALLLFGITLLVSFSTWEWDNTKLMIWSWLIVLPFLWKLVLARLPAWGRPLLCAALFFSGFVCLLGGLDARHTGYELARRTELDGLASALKGFPATATFAAVPTYNHPLLLLGHRVVMGYDGHLFSAGIDYAATEADLTQLMMGAPGWRDAARKLHADYLYWGPREQEKYAGSAQPWRETSLRAASGGWGTIYEIAE